MAECFTDAYLLCEDLAHQRFARAFLQRAGFDSRRIRNSPPVSGGSGEKFVRDKIVQEVRDLRRSHVRRALVVLIDADRFAVHERVRQLNEALADAREDSLDGRDNVIVLVPKWCIETWALVTKGESITEDASIDRASKSIDPKEWSAAADMVFDWCRDENKVPAHCVPSLRSSLPKLGTLRPC